MLREVSYQYQYKYFYQKNSIYIKNDYAVGKRKKKKLNSMYLQEKPIDK